MKITTFYYMCGQQKVWEVVVSRFTPITSEYEIITVVLFIVYSSVLLPSHSIRFTLNSGALFPCVTVSLDRKTP